MENILLSILLCLMDGLKYTHDQCNQKCISSCFPMSLIIVTQYTFYPESTYKSYNLYK